MPRFFTKLMANLFLAMRYLFARNLPPSYSLAPLGHISKIFRAFCCRQFFRATGRNVNIKPGAYFGSGRPIEIGVNPDIGVNCHVPCDIRINNDVMMGPKVLIIGQNQNHRFDDLTEPMRLQGYKASPAVVVEDDVWIGARVIILPGIRISTGTILGAGAIITRDAQPSAICVGNPARDSEIDLTSVFSINNHDAADPTLAAITAPTARIRPGIEEPKNTEKMTLVSIRRTPTDLCIYALATWDAIRIRY